MVLNPLCPQMWWWSINQSVFKISNRLWLLSFCSCTIPYLVSIPSNESNCLSHMLTLQLRLRFLHPLDVDDPVGPAWTYFPKKKPEIVKMWDDWHRMNEYPCCLVCSQGLNAMPKDFPDFVPKNHGSMSWWVYQNHVILHQFLHLYQTHKGGAKAGALSNPLRMPWSKLLSGEMVINAPQKSVKTRVS